MCELGDHEPEQDPPDSFDAAWRKYNDPATWLGFVDWEELLSKPRDPEQ